MTAYKIDVQCNGCEQPISFVLYGDKMDFECPECGHSEGKAKKYEGFIYVMWNKNVPDYVKIGQSVNPEQRKKQHSRGSVPGTFEIMSLFPSNRMKFDEDRVKAKLKRFKDPSSQEIFRLSPEEATLKVSNILSRRDFAYLSPAIKDAYKKLRLENKMKSKHLTQ